MLFPGEGGKDPGCLPHTHRSAVVLCRSCVACGASGVAPHVCEPSRAEPRGVGVGVAVGVGAGCSAPPHGAITALGCPRYRLSRRFQSALAAAVWSSAASSTSLPSPVCLDPFSCFLISMPACLPTGLLSLPLTLQYGRPLYGDVFGVQQPEQEEQFLV